jgi:phytoene/squalene synthetase
MGRLIGLLLGVAGIWAATEVYLHGTAGAFGGGFARLAGESATEQDGRSLGVRAGDAVGRARAEAEERRERLLAE